MEERGVGQRGLHGNITELGQAPHVKVAGKRCEVSIQCQALMEEVESSTEELPLPNHPVPSVLKPVYHKVLNRKSSGESS